MRSPQFALLLTTLAACSADVALSPDGPPGPGGDGGATARTYCGAQPVTRASTIAPDLRAWVLDAEAGGCHLERRSSGGAIDGFPTALDTFAAPGTMTCDADGCWTQLPSFARAWTHVSAPAAFTPPSEYLGTKWTGMVEAARHVDTGELRMTLLAMEYGSSALHRIERRYDAAGHLLVDREFFGGSLWFTTTNTWDGDRLVASHFVDTVNGTGVTDLAWTWTDGRLARVTTTHVDSGTIGVADLAYDDQGRPTGVVRTVDDAVWARQGWTYVGDRLTASSTEVVPALLGSTHEIRGADDLEPLLAASTQLEWAAARPASPAAGACASLPHAFGHGYPEADGVYHLGWAVGDRPSGIDGDYGFGPAYDSGQDRWFGHDRVEGFQWQPQWDAPSVRVEVAYDETGRMTTETLTSDDGSVGAIRTRTFDGERVATDTRVLEHGGETLTTTLVFAHDADGRVTERTYAMNNALVARHTWTYAGAIVARHGIAGHRVAEPGFDDPGVVPDGLDALGPLPAPIAHERRASADGRTLEILREGERTETRILDADGRITQRTGAWGGAETYAYEASGELRSYASDWGDGEPIDLLLAWERAPDGRLLARDWAYPHVRDRDVFTWSCE